jgi:large subunit ribosomal protein L4
MPVIEMRDTKKNPKGTLTLSDAVFSSDACESVVHSAVKNYLANQRQGTHATKTKGLVRGGGRKPYKQKSTGRARQGSTRSPLLRGGGIIFGPQPRDYRYKMNKNTRRVALCKALTMKLRDEEIVVIDSLMFEKPKTKDMLMVLKTLGVEGMSVLIVLANKNDTVLCSARNIPGVEVIRAADLNAYHVAVFNKLVLTADAIALLQGDGEGAAQ